MEDEMQIAIELDYRRVLIVPLSELGDVLRSLVARQYKQEGYGNRGKNLEKSFHPKVYHPPSPVLSNSKICMLTIH